MKKLSGQVAIVTGASRGIGRAIARGLAAEGATLLLVADETPEELAAAVNECRQAGAPTVSDMLCDVGPADAADKIVAAAVAAYGRVDVLVNNAGLRIRKPFGEFTAEEFDRLVSVDLRAPFLLSQAVLPHMRRQGGGRIINIASQLGTAATPESALYGLAKAGVIHLTKSMALELAKDNISVNAVSPGPIETEYARERWKRQPGIREARIAEVPMGRYGQPEEIAETVVFLATTNARFLHGADIIVDGGYVLP